jgi:hypothetical protein
MLVWATDIWEQGHKLNYNSSECTMYIGSGFSNITWFKINVRIHVVPLCIETLPFIEQKKNIWL